MSIISEMANLLNVKDTSSRFHDADKCVLIQNGKLKIKVKDKPVFRLILKLIKDLASNNNI